MHRGEIQGCTLRPSRIGGLAYSNEFRQLLRSHPGIIAAATDLIQRAEDAYDPGEIKVGDVTHAWNKRINNWETIAYRDQGLDEPRSLGHAEWGRGAILHPGTPLTEPNFGLEVTVLGKASRELGNPHSSIVDRLDVSSYLRISLGNQGFFVKKSHATTNPGFYEFSTSIIMREALRDTEGLGVVEAQLGYSDNHQSWFVSKWEELESQGFFPFDHWIGSTPNDYGQLPEKDYHFDDSTLLENEEILSKGNRMKGEIRAKAANVGVEIGDLDVNLFYNPRTGKFFYLDITARDTGKLGQELSRPRNWEI